MFDLAWHLLVAPSFDECGAARWVVGDLEERRQKKLDGPRGTGHRRGKKKEEMRQNWQNGQKQGGERVEGKKGVRAKERKKNEALNPEVRSNEISIAHSFLDLGI